MQDGEKCTQIIHVGLKLTGKFGRKVAGSIPDGITGIFH
jgi:hypothetical protein